jgi:hypothetical protein
MGISTAAALFRMGHDDQVWLNSSSFDPVFQDDEPSSGVSGR